MQFNTLLEIALNLSAQVIKMNLRTKDEFALVLRDIGIEAKALKDSLNAFEMHYLNRLEAINNAYEADQ